MQGLRCMDIGHYLLAAELFSKAMEAANCDLHPASRKDMVHMSNNVAIALQRGGALGEAWETYVETVRQGLEAPYENDGDGAARYSDVMFTLSNMAALLLERKENEKALYVLRVLEAVRPHLIPDYVVNTKVFDIFGNMGNALLQLGKRREAWDIFKQSLELRIAHTPDAHGAIANTILALGNICLMSGDFERAMSLYQGAATRLIRLFPRYYHPVLPGIYRNMAIACQRLGLVEKSEQFKAKAVDIEKTYSERVNTTPVADIVNSLVEVEKNES